MEVVGIKSQTSRLVVNHSTTIATTYPLSWRDFSKH
jgi:hypothetical protein